MATGKEVTKAPLEGEVISSTITVRDSEEYAKYSESQGRTRYGGEKGIKVVGTIEELRALINSNWKPSMIMEKWQIEEEEFKQLVWALSKKELRDKPLAFSIKNDYIRG